MKVLIVAKHKNNFIGGITPFVREQAEALEKCGVEIDYYLIEGNGLCAYFNTKGLIDKIHSFKPDVIHAHYGLSGITAVLQKEVPVVTTFHNGETLSWYVNVLCSWFSRRANHVIYVAQHIRDKSIFKADNYAIMPCGVNLSEIVLTPQSEARKQLSFNPDKKYILFGGAFSNLRKNYPLLQKAIELTGRDDIEVLEMRNMNRQQVTLAMCACDLFALPTKSEGSPQALKEAMACNCPIMATDVADIKHLLGEVAGHYICSYNPQEVATTIEKALQFNGRTEGRKRIEQLQLDNSQIAKKLIDIYKTII